MRIFIIDANHFYVESTGLYEHVPQSGSFGGHQSSGKIASKN